MLPLQYTIGTEIRSLCPLTGEARPVLHWHLQVGSTRCPHAAFHSRGSLSGSSAVYWSCSTHYTIFIWLEQMIYDHAHSVKPEIFSGGKQQVVFQANKVVSYELEAANVPPNRAKSAQLPRDVTSIRASRPALMVENAGSRLDREVERACHRTLKKPIAGKRRPGVAPSWARAMDCQTAKGR